MGVNQRASITLSDDEVAEFLRTSRTATMATIGPSGHPHLIAMWYGLVEGGKVGFETKAKAQKVANLRRDPRISVMVEAGDTYDQLRGVAIEGTAEIVEGDRMWDIGVSVFERYNGPYTEEMKGAVEFMLNKRVGVIVHPERVRTWDHRKLGTGAMPRAGSTADVEPS
jgi:PPOX class probable F420-dependent enzyme